MTDSDFSARVIVVLFFIVCSRRQCFRLGIIFRDIATHFSSDISVRGQEIQTPSKLRENKLPVDSRVTQGDNGYMRRFILAEVEENQECTNITIAKIPKGGYHGKQSALIPARNNTKESNPPTSGIFAGHFRRTSHDYPEGRSF
jgi:hypothetical protein